MSESETEDSRLDFDVAAPTPDAPLSASRWCLGLPLTGDAPLTDAARRQFLVRANRLRSFALSAWLTVPVTFFGAIAALTGAGGVGSHGQSSTVVGLVLVWIGVVAVQICKLNDWREEGRFLRSDAAGATLLHFAGPLRALDLSDDAQRKLLPYFVGLDAWKRATAYERSHWVFDPAAIFTIDVLSESGRILAANGADVSRRRLRAPIVETTLLPENASIAAQWLQPVATTPDGREVLTGRRELSRDEKTELAQFTGRIAKKSLTDGAIGGGAGLLGALILGSSHGPVSNGERGLLFFVFFSCLTYLLQSYLGRQLLQRLRADQTDGRVGIVEVAAKAPRPSAGSEPGTGLLLETLPRSRVVWTANREPARWRRLGKAVPEILRGRAK